MKNATKRKAIAAALTASKKGGKFYFIIGKRGPENAKHESEITHYAVAESIEDAKKAIGKVYERQTFMMMLKPEDTLFAFDPRTGHYWQLEVAF